MKNTNFYPNQPIKGKLTDIELTRVHDSIEFMAKFNNLDKNSDFSYRYIYNGFEYHIVATEDNIITELHNIPQGSHIANCIGNMNYTEAYKNN